MGQYEDQLSSAQNGQWGFGVQLIANQQARNFNDVISVSSPGGISQAWTVTLNAFRYASAIGNVLPLGGAAPADNQTSTGGATDPGPGVAVSVLWGTSNGTERAIVDYYARGNTFQIQASYVRLGILVRSTTGLVPPQLGGFIAPSPRVITAITGPTFTTSASPLVGAAASRRYPLPDRATAYRWSTNTVPVSVLNALQFFQADDTGAVVQYDGASPAVAGTPHIGGGSDYIPINKQSQFVTVVNNDVAAIGVMLTFLLDLG